MSWPQILLSAYMGIQWFAGIYRVARDDKLKLQGQVVGATLGVTFKAATVIFLAWWGGFYN